MRLKALYAKKTPRLAQGFAWGATGAARRKYARGTEAGTLAKLEAVETVGNTTKLEAVERSKPSRKGF